MKWRSVRLEHLSSLSSSSLSAHKILAYNTVYALDVLLQLSGIDSDILYIKHWVLVSVLTNSTILHLHYYCLALEEEAGKGSQD